MYKHCYQTGHSKLATTQLATPQDKTLRPILIIARTLLEAVEEEREWRGEGATGDSAAEDGEVRPPTPRRESEEERGGCSGGRLREKSYKC